MQKWSRALHGHQVSPQRRVKPTGDLAIAFIATLSHTSARKMYRKYVSYVRFLQQHAGEATISN